MRSNLSSFNSCTLCVMPTAEHKVIMAVLANKLKKLALQIHFPQNQEQATDLENQGFARLVQTLRLLKECRKPYQQPCRHLTWLKRMRKFIGCSSEKLDYFCHLAANVLSHKTYQLFLLDSQIKNCAATACGIVKRQGQRDLIKIEEESHEIPRIQRQKQVLKVQEEGKGVAQIETHGSTSTQDFASFIFDSSKGLWYQLFEEQR